MAHDSGAMGFDPGHMLGMYLINFISVQADLAFKWMDTGIYAGGKPWTEWHPI